MISRIYNLNRINYNELVQGPELESMKQDEKVLIQVFCGEDGGKLKETVLSLKGDFPYAKIISTTTDGEINQEDVTTNTTILSFTQFEKTTLNLAYMKEKNSYFSGMKLAKKLVNKKTKLLICFADGLSCNGEEFLQGIASVSKDVIVAGGLAGDNSRFRSCYVGIGAEVYSNGVVGVALDSDILQVKNFFNFGWEAIGLRHSITKADGNRVYMIGDLSAVDFYKKYLGDEIAQELPSTGIEFPLILDEQGFKKARAVTHRYKDGSLGFAGNVREGEGVYLGIANYENMLIEDIAGLGSSVAESFFIYSCMARRRFLPDMISKEIKLFSDLAPTAGFFTYGEFYTGEEMELLNQTLTAVSLSEIQDETKRLAYHSPDTKLKISKSKTFQALMNIINVTAKELHEQTLQQQKINQELEAKTNTLNLIQQLSNLSSWEFDMQSNRLLLSSNGYKRFSIDPRDPAPTLDEFVEMILPEYREKFKEFTKALLDGDIHSITFKVKVSNGKVLTLIESAKMIFDGDVPVKAIGTSLDITEVKAKDDLLIQQSKLAQMGEMVNMIAHQWRQPLHAISTTAIELDMKSKMDMLSKEDVARLTALIEYMTQNMSQTIDDFISFTKPTHYKEKINFRALVDEVLKIIGVQLKNHDIEIELDIGDDIYLKTYKKELEHVIINLLSNAREAFGDEAVMKKIILRVRKEADICVVDVKDNAGGIENEVLERIFEPYFTTKASSKGTGLGLYMSKKIVEEHLGGTIGVKNVDGGAEFTLKIKVCDDG